MFNQFTRYDTDWRKHHRRFMDEPSIIRQVIEIVIMLTVLLLLLFLLP